MSTYAAVFGLVPYIFGAAFVALVALLIALSRWK